MEPSEHPPLAIEHLIPPALPVLAKTTVETAPPGTAPVTVVPLFVESMAAIAVRKARVFAQSAATSPLSVVLACPIRALFVRLTRTARLACVGVDTVVLLARRPSAHPAAFRTVLTGSWGGVKCLMVYAVRAWRASFLLAPSACPS